jgi:uncharacterized protein (TIGR02996 family)
MTTSDQGAALLRAIALEPGELAHRLVYADWLEEQGRLDEAAFARAPGPVLPARRPGPHTPLGRLLAELRRFLSPSHRLRLVATVTGPLDVDVDRSRHVLAVVRYGQLAELAMPLRRALAAAARGLWGRHPVTTYRPLDYRPLRRAPDEWLWASRGKAREGHHLPRAVLGLLRHGEARTVNGKPERHYPDRDLALADLSAAVVGHGRELAVMSAAAVTCGRLKAGLT